MSHTWSEVKFGTRHSAEHTATLDNGAASSAHVHKCETSSSLLLVHVCPGESQTSSIMETLNQMLNIKLNVLDLYQHDVNMMTVANIMQLIYLCYYIN
jgi:hypothetical protein